MTFLNGYSTARKIMVGVLTVLISTAVVATIGSTIQGFSNRPTKSEIEKMINTDSPWLKDKTEVISSLSVIQSQNDTLTKQVMELRKDIKELLGK